MAEIGLIQGLSGSMGYDQRINDLRVREQEDERARAEAEARAKMFADDMEYNNALNEHDAPIIKQYATQQIKNIGKYYRENPDVLYNPEKLAQLNAMKKELKSNPDLNRGMASDESYRNYLKDLSEVAKNPSQHDTQAYQGVQGQWKNYLKYGNQDGQKAAEEQGKKAFIYEKPRDFTDLPPSLQKMGNSTKNYDIVKGSNPGEFYTKMRDQDLKALTDAAFQQHARQIDVETNRLGLTTPEQKYSWVKSQIESGFDKQHNLGDPTALRKLALQEADHELNKRKFSASQQSSAPYTTWDELMSTSAAKIPIKTAYNIWGGKGKIVLNGDNGQKVDLTGIADFKPDGVMYKPKEGKFKGIPIVTGYVELPMEEAINRGLVKEQSGFNPFDKDEPAPGFGNKVEIISGDHNGKPYKYVKAFYEMPVDTKDATAKSMYEGETMATKFRVGADENYGQPQKQPVSGSKDDFIKAGYTEEQISRGVKEGLINLK